MRPAPRPLPIPSPTIDALRERLVRKPEPATVADAKTGRPIHFDFTHRHLSAVLRLASYNDDQAALLPLSLHLAMHEDNFMPLANQFRVFARSLSDAFAYGMHNSVACSEDAPLIDSREAGPVRAQCHAHGRRGCAVAHRSLPRMAQGRGGRGPARAIQKQGGERCCCRARTIRSLLPNTPIIAQRAFADSKHVVIAGHGHGQIGVPCVDRVMANFIAAGSAKDLDVSCTQKVPPMPFFTTLAGPAP